VHGLCKTLADLGHDVHVYTTNRDGAGPSEVPTGEPISIDGVTVTYFPINFPQRLYYSHDMARHLNNTVSVFDIVHGHSLYLWPGWYTSRFCAKRNIPYVLSPHGMLTRSLVAKKNRLIKTLWIQLVERNNIKRASAVQFASRLELEEARRFDFFTGQYFITAHGVDMPPPATTLPDDLAALASRRPFVLYLGRLNWKKGIDNLIYAMADVDGAQLIIAGNDEENYRPHLDTLIESLGLQNEVTIRGPVWDANKARLMQDASVFVLPSHSENFGIAAMEAMSVGCPVICSSGTGIAEILDQDGAGLVTSNDSTNLATAIKFVLENRERATRIGARGRRAVAENYNWKRIGRITIRNYQRVINAHVAR